MFEVPLIVMRAEPIASGVWAPGSATPIAQIASIIVNPKKARRPKRPFMGEVLLIAKRFASSEGNRDASDQHAVLLRVFEEVGIAARQMRGLLRVRRGFFPVGNSARQDGEFPVPRAPITASEDDSRRPDRCATIHNEVPSA